MTALPRARPPRRIAIEGEGGGQSALSMEVSREQWRELQRELRGLGDQAPKVLGGAIRSSVNAIEGQIARAIGGPQGELNVTARTVRDRGMRKRFERREGNITGARLTLSGSRLGLGRFGARQTKRGVTYRISRGEPKKLLRRAWIADPRNNFRPLGVGARGIERGGMPNAVAIRPDGVSRKPVGSAQGPSIGHVAIESGAVRRLGGEVLGDRLVKETTQRVDAIIRRRGRG